MHARPVAPRKPAATNDLPGLTRDKSEVLERLAAQVRHLRRHRSWTQAHAAERAGLDLKHLQKIEAANLNVSLFTFVRLCDGFEVCPSSLLSPALTAKAEAGTTPTPSSSAAPLPEESLEATLARIGLTIAGERARMGFTQAQLARRAGLGISTIQQIEAGRQNITIGSLLLLARALGVRASALLG